MVDKNEQRCTEIASKLDKLSAYDRKFILWYVLQDYIDDCKYTPCNGDTAKDYALKQMLKKHLQCAEEMREVIGYDLW